MTSSRKRNDVTCMFLKMLTSHKIIGILQFCKLHVVQWLKVADKRMFAQNCMSDIKGAISEKCIFRQIHYISETYYNVAIL